MKKILAFFVGSSFCSVAFAGTLVVSTEGETTPEFTVEAQTMVRSRYVDSDTGILLYSKPVVQSYLAISHNKSGLYLELWHSTGFNTKADGWDDELDFTLGWSREVSALTITAEVSYCDDFEIGQMSYNDVVKGNLQVSLPTMEVCGWLTVTPFAGYTAFWVPDKRTPFEGGNLWSVGVETKITVTSKITVSSSTSVGWDDGIYGSVEGGIFRHCSSVDFSLTDWLNWNVLEFSAYVPVGNRDMPIRTTFGTGLSVRF